MAANVNPKIRNPAKSKNDPNSASMIPSETHSVLFEWPLSGLKTMFDSTKADTKSRVVKSTPFGGGRWTVLFYAQSGTDQFCSLYLNAEPLPHERTQSLNANSWMQASQNKAKNEMEDSWSREGNYRFTFTIQTPDKSVILGTKEANNHMFSMKTSNWGWAQFSKRDTVYYGNQLVKTADQFIITVSITASAERPRLMKPLSLNVPPQLVQAMGSLLDDPDHSDVVFHLVSQRRPSRSSNNNNNRRSKNSSITSPSNQQQSPVKKIYAIRKILSSRCEYFADMFEGGFAEAECAEFSDDEDDVGGNENQVWSLESPPSKDLGHNQELSTSDFNPQGGGIGVQGAYDALDEEHGQHGEATQANHNNNNSKDMDLDEEFYTDEEDEEDNFILEDSDEELEGPNNRETSPVTFNFGSKGVRSSNAQPSSSSRFNSRKSGGGGGGVGKEVRIGGDEGDEDEEDQDDDEFVEEDEVVGIPKPAGVGQNSSASTGNQRQMFGRQIAISNPNLNPTSNENATQPQQEGSNDNETPAFTFGSLSAVDNIHNISTSNSGGRFAQSQPQTSNLVPTAFGLTINPEIPTQSLMSRSNSNSTGPVPLEVSSTNQNLSLSNNSPSKNTNPILTPSSHTSTPVKKSTTTQNPKATPNPHTKRSREKSDGTNRTTDRRKRRKVNSLSDSSLSKSRRSIPMQVVRDSAYNTYKALLYYLYTDTITFAPLTSSFLTSDSSAQNDVEGDLSMNDSHRSNGLNAENYQEEMIKAHKRRQAMIDWWCSQNPDKPSPCSAKAMYKLADKLQIPELKRRAQEHIAASLTVQNIVWEVFSGFNAQFAEIRKMETDYLLQHWSIIKKSSAMKTIFFRSQAHPGLAEVWPYLLSQLEYKASGDDSDSETEQV